MLITIVLQFTSVVYWKSSPGSEFHTHIPITDNSPVVVQQSPVLPKETVTSIEQQVTSTNKSENNIASVEDRAHINRYAMVAIGDSLTLGVGDDTNNGGYVGRVQSELELVLDHSSDVYATNLGRKGLRSDQLLQRLNKGEMVEDLTSADVITMSIGGNDLMRVVQGNILNLTYEPFREEAILFEQRLQDILVKVREHNADAPIYVLGLFNPFHIWFEEVPEMDTILQEWNDTVQRAAQGYEGVVFVPIEDIFTSPEAERISPDMFHPSAVGYSLIAKRVLTFMVPDEKGATG
jgi:lysophospholipase L1-like esterase